MKSTVCSHCGGKILTHWTVCPICAQSTGPATITVAPPGASVSDFSASPRSIYCVQCKAIVAPDAQTCSGCHLLIVRRYCSGCSRLIPEQAEFCPYCDTSSTAKKSRFRSFAQSALIFAAPVCVISAFVFFVYRVSNEPVTPPPPTRAVKMRAKVLPPVASIVPAAIEHAKVENPVEVRQTEIVEQEIDQPPGLPEPEPTEIENETSADLAEEPAVQPVTPPVTQPVMKPPAKPDVEIDSTRGARLLQGRKLTKHASLLMQKGRYSDASVVLRNALSAFPAKTEDLSYGEALYKLGICLRKKGSPEQAIPVLKQALRFPYYRAKALREVEAATSQLKKISRVRGR